MSYVPSLRGDVNLNLYDFLAQCSNHHMTDQPLFSPLSGTPFDLAPRAGTFCGGRWYVGELGVQKRRCKFESA